jgi:hypothetical protein
LITEEDLEKPTNPTQTEDIYNKKFSRLTAVEYMGYTKKEKRAVWKFKCDCGNYVLRKARSVKKSKNQSCGCLRREMDSKRAKDAAGDWSKKDPNETTVTDLHRNYKNNAKRNNREFNLTKEDVKKLIYSECFYCDNPSSNTSARKNVKNDKDFIK